MYWFETYIDSKESKKESSYLFGSERSLRSADVVGLWVGLWVLIMLYSSSEEFLRVPKCS